MANTIKIGADEIDDIKVGSVQVDKVYVGADLVWQKAEPPGEWPAGTSGELAMYSGMMYDFNPGASTETEYHYANRVFEGMPYYVIWHVDTEEWTNGTGDPLGSTPIDGSVVVVPSAAGTPASVTYNGDTYAFNYDDLMGYTYTFSGTNIVWWTAQNYWVDNGGAAIGPVTA